MANPRKSADALIGDITDQVRAEMIAAIRPLLRDLTAATAKLESALSGKAKRGRPAGNGRRKKKAPAARRKRRVAKRAPRGSLEVEIKKALQSGPARISQIRVKVQKSPLFKGHNPKNLYSMITQRLGKMPGVKKAGKGYGMKGAKK